MGSDVFICEICGNKDPKYLGTFCSVANKDEVIPAKKFNGYNTPDGQAVTEDKEQLVFLYTPIEYF